MPNKKPARAKKSQRAKVKKVPKVEKKVTVIHLYCPNCGEEEEKVLYCQHCESPLEIKEAENRPEEDVELDDTVVKDVEENGSDTDDEPTEDILAQTSEDGDVDDMIRGGLDPIFAGGEGGSVSSSDDSDIPVDDVVDSLDQE